MSLLLAAIFVVSFGFSLYYQIGPTVDAKAYNIIARNLAWGHGYVEDAAYTLTPERDDAIVRVGPGYEFFVAGIYALFGYHYWVVWLVQALLRAATAYVLFQIVLLVLPKHEGRERIGLLTAAFFSFVPDLIILNGMLLAETLFVASVVFGLYASLCALEMNKSHLGAGFWWGIASLVRPTALAFTLCYAGYVYVMKKNIVVALSVLLFPLVLLGWWSLRNSLVYQAPLFTTTAGAYALWVGNNPDAMGGFDKTPEIQQIRDQYHSVELSKIGMQKYFEFLRGEPQRFLALQIKKTTMYFSVLRPSGFWFYLSNKPIDRLLTLISSSLATMFLFVMGGAGMYWYIVRQERYRWFLISVAFLQPLTVIPTYVETRYRAPFFPFLAFFAAYLVCALWQHRKDMPPLLVRALCFSGVLILLFTIGDSFYSYDIIRERVDILFSQLSISL